MKHWRPILLFGIAALLTACGGSATPTPLVGVPPTVDVNATVVATSAVPTGVAMASEALPSGTLILTQLSRPIAQTPDQRIIALPDDRFGAQGSPSGRYGVRLKQNKEVFDLELVDYSTMAAAAVAIPEAVGLSGPGITWKPDSSGFAFFDFPLPGLTPPSSRTIFFFSVETGQTSRLIPNLTEPGKIATSISFSPDGKYLLYAIGDAGSEGIGGPDSRPMLLDTTTNQTTPLPADAVLGFSQWLADSSGFLVLRIDLNTGGSGVYLYALADLNNARRLTPDGESDFLADLSPDGKWLAVTSTGADGNTSNIIRMSLDGRTRTQITQFTDPQQTVTGLVWGTDGIYYSLTGADSSDTTWRMDLDGRNPTQVANGTLYRIIGAG